MRERKLYLVGMVAFLIAQNILLHVKPRLEILLVFGGILINVVDDARCLAAFDNILNSFRKINRLI